MARLPLELYEMVVEYVVEVPEWELARNLRLVCRASNEVVIRSIIRSRALEEQRMQWRRPCGKSLVYQYVLARIEADHKRTYALSSMIGQTMDFIINKYPEHESRRQEYSRMLCEVSIDHWHPLKKTANGILNNQTSDPYLAASGILLENVLTAAVLLGIFPLVQELLTNYGVRPLVKYSGKNAIRLTSTYFGNALIIAASKNDLKTVRLLIDKCGCTPDFNSAPLRAAVKKAGEMGNELVLFSLLDQKYAYFPPYASRPGMQEFIRMTRSQSLSYDGLTGFNDDSNKWLLNMYKEAITSVANGGQLQTLDALLDKVTSFDFLKELRFAIENFDGSNDNHVYDWILIQASKSGQANIARYALNKGANPHVRNVWRPSYTPYTSLEEAAENGHENVVRILLERLGNEKKGNNRLQQKILNRSLLFASRGGWLRVAQLLIEYGAEISPIDEQRNHNEIPIVMAVMKGHVDTALWLMNSGARLDERVTDGRSNDEVVGNYLSIWAANRGYNGFLRALNDNGYSEKAFQGTFETLQAQN